MVWPIPFTVTNICVAGVGVLIKFKHICYLERWRIIWYIIQSPHSLKLIKIISKIKKKHQPNSCNNLSCLLLDIWNERPTDVTISILFIYRRVSTSFGLTGPSSGEFTQLFTQPLVQWMYRSGRVFCMYAQHTEHAARTVHPLNQWLCEQLSEFSWGWACRPETCRDPSIYE
jgi:hypothetical protein